MAQGDKKDLDLSRAIEQGTQRTTLSDLEKKGVRNVKILDEKALQELVTKAVDRVVNARTQTAEERERVLADSRKELDRLMKEHKAARSRAQLLESDKNELIEQVESLQRELSLQADLEEENLQKKFLEGTASMEKQVGELREKMGRELAEERSKVREADQARRDAVAQILKLQHDAAAAAQEIKTLKEEVIRQRSELTRLKETGGAVDAEKKAREAAEHAAWMLEQRLADLQRQFEALEAEAKAGRKATSELDRLREELKGEQARAEAFRAKAGELDRVQGDAVRLEKKIDSLREELEASRRAAAVDQAVLKERTVEVERLKAKVIEEHERAEKLGGALEKLRQASAVRDAVLKERDLEVGHLKKKVREDHDAETALREELEKLRRAAAVDQAVLRERSIEVGHLKDKVLEEHGRAEALKAAEDRLRLELAQAVKAIADASAVEAESRGRLEGLKAELARMAAAEAERNRLAQEVDALRRELSSAAERQESGVVLAAEIQKIEDLRHEEEKELERLRGEVAGLRSHEERLRSELRESRTDIRSLYEIVEREQGLARSAQDESVSLHQKALEILGKVGGLEKALAERRSEAKPDLSPELERLTAALAREKKEAEARLKALAANLGPEIERLRAALAKEKKEVERLGAELAREKKTAARPDPLLAKLKEAVRRSRVDLERAKKLAKRPGARALEKLETALARAKAAPPAGVGLDGRGLLEDFLRRVQLKELFQKHVPIQGRNGRTHPSETLLEVVEAAAAGRRAARTDGRRLEVFGAPGKPTLDELKAFQARLAPRAVRQIERVHDGLRHQLVPLPPKGERLVLDVDAPRVEIGKKGRGGAYAPLVCFDGARGEFWKARLRGAKAEPGDGALPFLRECLAKIPRGFARGRVLLRLDGGLYSEPVLRFLERSGAGYVMPAPDTKEIRAAAKKAPLREISGGWAVGEFELKVHPIRGTKGRFVVLRRKSGETHVLLADRKTGPWRAWTALAGRPAALAAERELLAGWADSPLLGRGRRARSAAFTNHLLASDLLQWFKRAGLPPSEQARSQESLRKDVLLLSPPDEKRRESTVLVLPKKDGRGRLYRKVAERLGRLRTSAPFKLGR